MPKPLWPERPILVVDDEPSATSSLRLLLRMNGYTNLIECADSREVLPLLRKQPVGIVLLDLMMPHLSGMDLLGMLADEFPQVVVIIITGMNQVDYAIRCMKLGAFDYLVKPVDEGKLLAARTNAVRYFDLRRENDRLRSSLLRQELEHPEHYEEMITGSAEMLRVFRYIEAVAPFTEPVLITGDTGTGKELVARAVHQASGREGPFVALNVAGVDDAVFSDTLFGHTHGAYTGAATARQGLVEKAAGGTLFLDEIGDLRAESQIKLLRLLQEGEYYPVGADEPRRCRARFVLASNRPLHAMADEGVFRRDLLYRLSTHRVHLPPLRKRRDDLPLLVEHFVRQACQQFHRTRPAVPPELLQVLRMHSFPGNIRELRAMLFDAVACHRGGRLGIESIRKAVQGEREVEAAQAMVLDGQSVALQWGAVPTVQQALHDLAEAVLRHTGGNRRLACELLGVSRPTLLKYLKEPQ